MNNLAFLFDFSSCKYPRKILQKSNVRVIRSTWSRCCPKIHVAKRKINFDSPQWVEKIYLNNSTIFSILQTNSMLIFEKFCIKLIHVYIYIYRFKKLNFIHVNNCDRIYANVHMEIEWFHCISVALNANFMKDKRTICVTHSLKQVQTKYIF